MILVKPGIEKFSNAIGQSYRRMKGVNNAALIFDRGNEFIASMMEGFFSQNSTNKAGPWKSKTWGINGPYLATRILDEQFPECLENRTYTQTATALKKNLHDGPASSEGEPRPCPVQTLPYNTFYHFEFKDKSAAMMLDKKAVSLSLPIAWLIHFLLSCSLLADNRMMH